MLPLIGIAVLGAAAAVVGIAARKPNEFRLSRSTRIKAPADRIFANLVDFHRWEAWSPWEKLDPALKRTHSGATSGKGAVYEWEGNAKVGKGRMEIVEAVSPNRMVIAMHFLKPMESRATTEFSLVPSGDATEVTWSMSGQSPFIQKVMGVLMDMDAMLGKSFEQGLASLKTISETR